MLRSGGVRFAIEAVFIALVALGAKLADLEAGGIIVVMAAAWLLTVLIETTIARSQGGVYHPPAAWAFSAAELRQPQPDEAALRAVEAAVAPPPDVAPDWLESAEVLGIAITGFEPPAQTVPVEQAEWPVSQLRSEPEVDVPPASQALPESPGADAAPSALHGPEPERGAGRGAEAGPELEPVQHAPGANLEADAGPRRGLPEPALPEPLPAENAVEPPAGAPLEPARVQQALRVRMPLRFRAGTRRHLEPRTAVDVVDLAASAEPAPPEPQPEPAPSLQALRVRMPLRFRAGTRRHLEPHTAAEVDLPASPEPAPPAPELEPVGTALQHALPPVRVHLPLRFRSQARRRVEPPPPPPTPPLEAAVEPPPPVPAQPPLRVRLPLRFRSQARRRPGDLPAPQNPVAQSPTRPAVEVPEPEPLTASPPAISSENADEVWPRRERLTVQPDLEPEPQSEPEPAAKVELEPELPGLPLSEPEPVAVKLPPRPASRRRAVPPPLPPPMIQSVPRVPTLARGQREWNVCELERLARQRAGRDVARDEEWAFLLVHLREFAGPDGTLPVEFDPLVRESFPELIEAGAR